MNTKKYIKLIFALFITISTANALTLTYNSNFTWDQVDFTNKTLTLPEFSINNAILNSATFSINAEYWVGYGFPQDNNPIIIENTQPTVQNVDYTVSADYYANLSGNVTGLDSNIQFDDNSAYGAQPLIHYVGTMEGNSSVTAGPALLSESYDKTITDILNLNSFYGSGSFSYLFDSVAITQIIGAGNLNTFISTWAKGDMEITYDYDYTIPPSVPEPMTIFSFLFIIIGITFYNKKKFNKI